MQKSIRLIYSCSKNLHIVKRKKAYLKKIKRTLYVLEENQPSCLQWKSYILLTHVLKITG